MYTFKSICMDGLNKPLFLDLLSGLTVNQMIGQSIRGFPEGDSSPFISRFNTHSATIELCIVCRNRLPFNVVVLFMHFRASFSQPAIYLISINHWRSGLGLLTGRGL